ncbi:restriction endonuclease [Corallococcus sp. AB050B]|nr:restriction endonuclease [Corallococcus sp. AB050B]
MSRSTYDELHDKYYSISTSTAGTRYERLVALVFKALDKEDGVVVHNISLRGATDVAHQIDVQIEHRGVPHRVLIECKDFDVSGDPVGLPIVRNFFAVIEDIRPDDAIIITCNDFTRDAKKYAKAKNIKLVTIRASREEDWNDRMQRFSFHLRLRYISGVSIEVKTGNQDSLSKLSSENESESQKSSTLENPLYISIDNRWLSIVDLINKEKPSYPEPPIDRVSKFIRAPMARIGNNEPHSIEGVSIEYRFSTMENDSLIELQGLARLIVRGFGESDLIVWDMDFRRFTITANGEVVAIDQL